MHFLRSSILLSCQTFSPCEDDFTKMSKSCLANLNAMHLQFPDLGSDQFQVFTIFDTSIGPDDPIDQYLSQIDQTKKIVINEVLINPIGSDSQKEWIELYHPNDQSIDLKGMSLFYQNQLIMECISGQLPPQSFFVISSNNQTIRMIKPEGVFNPINAKDLGIECITQHFKFENTTDFIFELANQYGQSIDRFEGLATDIKNGVSLTRLKGGTDSMIVNHDALSDLIDLSPPRMHSMYEDLTMFFQLNQEVDPNALGMHHDLIACRQAQKREIILNEVMPNPNQNQPQNQWIEILNPTDHYLSLSEMTISLNTSLNEDEVENHLPDIQLPDLQSATIKFPETCISPHSTCYLWPNRDPIELLCAHDFVFYSIENFNHSFNFNLYSTTTMHLSLKRNQVLIDFVTYHANQVQEGISFNRLIDGKDGPLILHSEIAPHLNQSFFRCANGKKWDNHCE
jgi:hypothetical protein